LLQTKENDNICGGSWTAAKNVGRKKKSLDETGLEVATCRHVIAQKAINMKQGEQYGYALYLMKHYMVKWKVEYCWADVMCKLWKFAQRIDPDICKLMKPALSTMHAKGHSIQCQVNWDGLWIEGTGRSTGEETEQFFSYIYLDVEIQPNINFLKDERKQLQSMRYIGIGLKLNL